MGQHEFVSADGDNVYQPQYRSWEIRTHKQDKEPSVGLCVYDGDYSGIFGGIVRHGIVIGVHGQSRNDSGGNVAFAYCMRDVCDLRDDGYDDGRFKGLGGVFGACVDFVGGGVRSKAFIYCDGVSDF